ncbi:type I-E CRISPR-associated endoribonuclease Cas2 [Micrococcus sp. FDAARGOS_333]|uniref:type I-E CRISPR-associated endoribonuclease Cas2 n=1 Tax=Micrococcus sp. FDAARGOS_333 TaxID=1930558 RepID=UPI000FD9B16F
MAALVTLIIRAAPRAMGTAQRYLTRVSEETLAGRMSTRTREALWDLVCQEVDETRSGRAVMIHPDPSAPMGYIVLQHSRSPSRTLIQDGLVVSRRRPNPMDRTGEDDW